MEGFIIEFLRGVLFVIFVHHQGIAKLNLRKLIQRSGNVNSGYPTLHPQRFASDRPTVFHLQVLAM